MTYEVIGHEPPLKPIDLRGRRKIVTLAEIWEGTVRQPDPAAYEFDPDKGWVLKDGG